MSDANTAQHLVVDGEVTDALAYAWAARDALGIDPAIQGLMQDRLRRVADGTVDMAHGSRVLGHAEPNHFAREMGIVFFNRLVSAITRTHVTDCSNGYRAVRTKVLPQLVLRQEQFHTSEFMIEAIKRGIPAKEVPVTVVSRISGHSKKPAVLRYGLGFTNAIMRTWLR